MGAITFGPGSDFLKSKKTKGDTAFFEYYSAIYGERWPDLLAKLKEEPVQVERPNRFAKEGLKEIYAMDAASIVAAETLAKSPGGKTLDLCAAPGGKSLILAESMSEEETLVVNELSDNRRKRLRRVLHEYLPEELLQKIKITGHDGSRWGLYEEGVYDRVLVDAPCSGERHLLETKGEMEKWSKKRGEKLAIRQYALLAAAWQAVKENGHILYSTCSINPKENDGVIAKLLKRKEGEVEKKAPEFEVRNLEATEHGFILLPDRSNAGPIYFSLLKKNVSS